jgi:hypothetical protein
VSAIFSEFPTSQRVFAPEDHGHVFRSTALEQFARIEVWATETIEASDPTSKKLPHLFGQKVEFIRQLMKTRSQHKQANLLKQLLRRLDPLLSARTILAHGRLETVETSGGHIHYIFQTGKQAEVLPGKRLLVRDRELDTVLGELRQLADAITAVSLTSPV